MQKSPSYEALRAEVARLKEENQRLRDAAASTSLSKIADLLPLSVAYVDGDMLFQYVNPAYAQMHRAASKVDIVGKHVSEVLGSQAYDQVFSAVKDAFSGKVVSYECMMSYPSGGQRIVRAHLVPDIDAQQGPKGAWVFLEDITAEKQEERTLPEKEERLRLAMEAAGIGFWDLNVPEGVLRWSEGVASLCGLAVEELPATWDGFTSSMLSEDRSAMNQLFQELLAERLNSGHIEYRIARPDGVRRWMGSSVRVCPDNEGKRDRIIGTIGDVTARKEAELAIKRSEEQLRVIFENAVAAIFMLDMNMKVAFANQRGLEMFGYDAHELMGKSYFELVHPAQREDSLQNWEKFNKRSSSHFNVERLYLRKNGSSFWGHISMRMLPGQDGAATRYTSVITDIDCLKQTEEALRQNEEMFKSIARDLPGVVFQFAASLENRGSFRYIGERSEEILGLPATPMETGFERFMACIVPGDLGRFQQTVDANIRQFASSDFEGRFVRPDTGNEIYVRIVSHVLWKKEEAVWSGIVLDVTEQKRAEESLRESERIFRTVFESSPYAMAMVNREGAYQAVNPAGAAILGVSQEEALGKTFVDFMVDSSGDRTSLIERLSRDKRVENELITRTRLSDGAIKHLLYSAVVVEMKGESRAISMVVDVTEQKLAEEALAANQQQLANLMANLPGMVYRCRNDKDYSVLFINETCVALTGYRPADFMSKRVTLGSIINPADVEEVRQKIDGALARRGHFQLIYRIKTASQEEKWVWEQGGGVFDGDKLLGLEGFIADITEQKKAEEAFQTILRGTSRAFGEHFFRAIVEELAHAYQARYAWIGELHPSQPGQLRTAAYWAGDRIADNFEYDLANSPFRLDHHEVCFFPDNLQQQFPNDRLLANLGVQSCVGITLFNYTGKPIGVLSVYHDQPMVETSFTRPLFAIFASRAGAELERLNSEKARYESDRRLREMLETMNLLAVMFDDKGGILFCNDCLLNLTGARREEVLGKNWFQEFVPEFERSKALERFTRDIAAGSLVPHIERPILTRSGQVRQIRWDVTVIRDADGAAVGAAHVGRDLTTELELEKQLRSAQKLEALGTLAGGIAHDFNNILGGVIGYAELSKMLLNETDTLYMYQDEILTAGLRAKELVQQILTVARQQEQVKAPVEVHLIVKEVIRLISKVLPSTVEIKKWIDPEAGVVLADPAQLHQVLMNLCANAAHAMREQARGVLEVRLETCLLSEEEAHRLGDLYAGEYVQLQVLDNGHGMNAETMNRIFDPYFTTKKLGEGTGLGLAVVRGIVTSHGGAVHVESEPGRGSRFQVYLPRISSPKVKEKTGDPPHARGSERILLVDDESQLVNTGRSMLQHLGYQVTAVNSSPEALKIFLARPFDFDLVLTDQTMPDICGTGLAEEILACRPDMPVVLCSGYSDRVNHDKAKELGIREFLEKPMTMGSLSGAVRRALGKETGEKVN